MKIKELIRQLERLDKEKQIVVLSYAKDYCGGEIVVSLPVWGYIEKITTKDELNNYEQDVLQNFMYDNADKFDSYVEGDIQKFKDDNPYVIHGWGL